MAGGDLRLADFYGDADALTVSKWVMLLLRQQERDKEDAENTRQDAEDNA